MTASVLVWIVLGGATADGVTLVEQGKPCASIVLPADADKKTKLAAEELNLYLRKATGAVLPIAGQAKPGAVQVRIGVRDAAERKHLRLDELPFGGFVTEARDGVLTLAGKGPEGDLNAVYAFLEDVLGVRWFMPTDLGENVPRTRTVRVSAQSKRVIPRFVNRRTHGIRSSAGKPGLVWKRRVRITSHDRAVPFNRYSHNLYAIIRPSKYGKTHPEYFPIRGGKRYVPTTDRDQSWQPCTTHPDVVRISIETARRFFDAHPDVNCFSLGINDSRGFCECPRCKALDTPGREFRGRPVVSERYFTYVKQVADALLQTHPDRYVTCIAYSVVEAPPANLRLPRNVGVVITQDVAQWHDPAYKQADMDIARAWAGKAGVLGIYNYTSLGWLLPRAHVRRMAEALRFYDQLGVVAMTNESWPSFWCAGPLMYARAKLMWDPKLDCDRVLDEFYTGFFGPAAAPMKRLYDVFERTIGKPRPGRWFEGLSSVPDQIALWDTHDLADCRQAAAEARQAAAGSKRHAARVELVARGFAYVDAILEEYWQARRVRELAADADAAPDLLQAELERLIERAGRRKAAWRDIEREPLIAGNYQRIRRERAHRLSSWQAYVGGAVPTAVGALMGASGPAARKRASAFVAKLPDGPIRAELAAWLWAQANPDAKNLMANPGAESTTGRRAAPKGVGWVSSHTPPGWSKWAQDRGNLGHMTWETNGGRAGPKCLKIGPARNACFIQTHPVKPGERYVVSVWTRTTGAEPATAGLFVQWKNAKGAWARGPARRQVTVTGQIAEWRALSLAFTVPTGVARAVILLRGQDVNPGSAVLFDDTRLVRVPPDPAKR